MKMVNFLKVVISLGIAMAWYQLTQNQETAIFFFILMLGILFIRPIPYQKQSERVEYMEKYRRAKERQKNFRKISTKYYIYAKNHGNGIYHFRE